MEADGIRITINFKTASRILLFKLKMFDLEVVFIVKKMNLGYYSLLINL